MRTALAVVMVIAACRAETLPRPPSPAAPAVAASPEPAPLGPLPADVHPTHEALVLELDPASERFGGTAELALHLDRPRDVIWLHGRGLAVTATSVTAGSGERLVGRWEEVDPIGVARVTLPSPVVGDITLRVVFDTPYDPQLVGVYRVDHAVFSKFEAIYARRAFPCFDEPAFKIPFDVTLVVPAAAAVTGNMSVIDEASAGTGKKRVRFATTPPLPTYLVVFAVGPFESHTTMLPATAVRPAALPIGVVAPAGHGSESGYALAEEPLLLAEEERYFGVAFPFPKLDLVAVPDFQSGAMENAGAITFRDSLLLVDDKVTSFRQRMAVTSVLAHETAHQWFGDLVTMRWWDDLWLNEGFATFLATKTLRAVHPELDAELEALTSIDQVMNQDSLATARRVRQPIETTNDITNAFDGITYEKGAAFLTMVEHFIGEAVFRRAIHGFLADHARANATTDDLVTALSAQAGRDLKPLFASFLDQPGVPVVAVHATCDAGKGHLALEQARWRPAGSTLSTDALWTIPVCMRVGAAAHVDEVCTVLAERTGALELPACADWVMPNAGATGYYRFTQPADELARLSERGIRTLSTVERLALADDLAAAFRSGVMAGDSVLLALDRLAHDPHGSVAVAPLELYGFIDDFMVTGAQRAALRAHVARLYAPAAAALGWRPTAQDTPSRRLYRSEVLGMLALTIEDRAMLGQAARLGRQLAGIDGRDVRPAGSAAEGRRGSIDGRDVRPAGSAAEGRRGSIDGRDGGDGKLHPEVVDPDLAQIALSAAVRAGDARVFDALVTHLVASDDAQIRQRMLTALASARDPVLVRRALDLALDPRLRHNERVITIAALLGAMATRDVAWAWLKDHFDALAPMLPDRYAGYMPLLVKVCDPATAGALRSLFTSRVGKLTGGPRNLAQALEAAEQCSARVAAQQASVERFVRAL